MKTCPKCFGGLRMPANDRNRGCYGYDQETDSLPCNNCGGQTMELKATGLVPVDPATGEGCMHQFEGRNAGNCYTVYKCTKCHYSFPIDSGD